MFSSPAVIIIFLLLLVVTLGIFSQSTAEVFSKQDQFTGSEEAAQNLARTVVVSGRPVIIAGCTKERGSDIFNYKFTVSGLEAFFQGLSGRNERMSVFAVLNYGGKTAKDRERRTFALDQGVTRPFGTLEFDIKTGQAPLILLPDNPADVRWLSVGQPLVVSNFKITPFRQFSYSVPPVVQTECFTDMEIRCRTESRVLSITSCAENQNICAGTLVLCGEGVRLQASEYSSGTCGSRKIRIYAQANKQADGWEYTAKESPVMHFWRLDPRQADNCWQNPLSEGCSGKYLGAYLFNLSSDKYNVAGCLA